MAVSHPSGILFCMSQIVQTLRFTVKCSRFQHRRLTEVFGMCSELYNAALESWKGTYRWWKEHHPEEPLPRELYQSHYDRLKMFTDVRRDHPEWERLSVKVGRGVLCRFDRAVRAFYKRCKEGKNPGHPRFKPSRRWRSIEIPDASPGMLVAPGNPKNGSKVWWRLAVKGLPRLKFRDKGDRLAIALGSGGRLVELRVVRTPLRTEIHAVLKHPEREMPDPEPSRPVGLDRGLRIRLALSDGTRIPARVPEMASIKRSQRKLSRARKGSQNRRKKALSFARAHRREKERAVQADFRLAHHLVSTYDAIAVENLGVAGMLRAKRFSRKLSDQRWSSLDRILEHKAWKAGVPYVRVDPRHTSTDCSFCGHRQPMPLLLRVFQCGRCGLELDRDVNAARNIGARAFGPGSGGTTPDAMRQTNFRRKTTTTLGLCVANGHRRTVSPELATLGNPGI